MITSWIHTHVPDDFMFILYSVIIIIIIIIIYYLFIYLFKVDDTAKILHAQKIYIKLSSTRIWYAN